MSRRKLGKGAVNQILLLLIGLVVPVGIPLFRGVEYYGQFVTLTATAFLAQRLIDVPTEALTSRSLPTNFLALAFPLHVAMFMISLAANYLLVASIDLPLLLSLQLSTLAFARTACQHSQNKIFLYLLSFAVCYALGLASTNSLGLSLRDALVIVNCVMGVWLILPVADPLPNQQFDLTIPRTTVNTYLRSFTGLSAGLIATTLTVGLAALSSNTMDATGRGQVRLVGTVLGFSAFLLPIPLRSIIPMLRNSDVSFFPTIRSIVLGAQGLALCAFSVSALLANSIPTPWTALAMAAACFLAQTVVERIGIVFAPSKLLWPYSILGALAGILCFNSALNLPPIETTIFAIFGSLTVHAATSMCFLRFTPQSYRSLVLGSGIFTAASALLYAVDIFIP